jgi:hypothetical protein
MRDLLFLAGCVFALKIAAQCFGRTIVLIS